MRQFVSSLLLSVSIISLHSCSKDSSEPPPVIPSDTTVTFLPTFISLSDPDNPENNVASSIKYLLNDKRIEVYTDNATTTNPYDLLSDVYQYNSDGFLSKWQRFNKNGGQIQSFVPERDQNNILKRVLVETTDFPYKDTFNISFSDSTGTSLSYKIMRIENTYRNHIGAEFPIFDEYTFLAEKLISVKGGHFSSPTSEINLIHADYLYEPSRQFLVHLGTKNIYGTAQSISYRYQAGTGLDSFYRVLEGKDGFYLSTYGEWPTSARRPFFFSPIYLILYYNGYQKHVVTHAHKSGVVREVKSLTDDVTFSLQNTLDTNQRIIETNVFNNGVRRGILKVNY